MTKCNPHPMAPHGFDRNASHNADRYVCECEGWQPDNPIDKLIADAYCYYQYDNGTDTSCFEFTADEMKMICDEIKRLREYEWQYKDLCD